MKARDHTLIQGAVLDYNSLICRASLTTTTETCNFDSSHYKEQQDIQLVHKCIIGNICPKLLYEEKFKNCPISNHVFGKVITKYAIAFCNAYKGTHHSQPHALQGYF